jgi:hypothetical protein
MRWLVHNSDGRYKQQADYTKVNPSKGSREKLKKGRLHAKMPCREFLPEPKFGKNLNVLKITIARFLISFPPKTVREAAWLCLL